MSASSDSPPPSRRWLDRDLVVAASAIIISVASLVVSVQQTLLMREQQQASVWPRVTVDGTITSEPPAMHLSLRNAGIGPAKLVWGQVLVDGRPLASWDTLFAAAAQGMGTYSATSRRGSLSNDVLSAGQTKEFFSIEGPFALRVAALGPRLALETCYCSVFDTCWRLRVDFKTNRESVTETPRCDPPTGPTL